MKASSPPLAADVLSGKRPFAVYADLCKACLTTLVLVTTGVGFFMGSSGALEWVLLWHTLVGTGFLAAGAAAFNQLLEREHDARMQRTCDRPLPSGRLRPRTVWLVGTAAAVVGLSELLLAVNRPAAVLGAITLILYLFLYTPLKRLTPLNTIVGAVPGALPPLLGWTAARGTIEIEGWSLFAILVFWQLPHFLAIAWIYRDDYARAGFAMLSVSDSTGERTSAHALAHTLGLLAVSLAPFVLGMSGPLYLAGALGLGSFFLWRAFRFAREVSLARARQLFFASILYLPFLLGLMVLDRWCG